MCCIKSNNNKQTNEKRKKKEEKVHSGTFCFQVHKFICESWALKVLCVYHEYTAETQSFAAIYQNERSWCKCNTHVLNPGGSMYVRVGMTEVVWQW